MNTKKITALTPYLFCLPAFALHAAIVSLPSLSTLYYSLFEWNGIGAGTFIGFKNFVDIMHDRVVKTAIINNVKWMCLFITIPIIVSLIVAFMLSRVKKGQILFRMCYFLPYVISAAVLGKVWITYYNPYFGFNTIFEKLGLEALSKVLWLGEPKLALFSVAFVDIWHWWGFPLVLFLGAIQQINPELYEAGRVEGTNSVQELLYITLPGIMPTFVFVILTTIMWSFLTFDFVWIMTNGGPGQSTEMLSSWIYKNAFMMFKAGYANALCIVQSAICVITYFVMRVIQKRGWDV